MFKRLFGGTGKRERMRAYSPSHDPRIDDVLQRHPLAVIRSSVRRARATWEYTNENPSRVRRRPLPASSAPKTVLSDTFFEALRAMLKQT